MFDRIMNYFTAANTMEFLLALLVFVVLAVLVRMTLNPRDGFDLKDLVGQEGKLDEKKFTRFGAWVISTWGFVYLLVSKPETFPEWYFTVYMGAWVLNVIIDKYVSKPVTLQDPVHVKYNTVPIEPETER